MAGSKDEVIHVDSEDRGPRVPEAPTIAHRSLGDRLFTRERLRNYPLIIVGLSILLWLATVVAGDPPLAASGSAVLPDFLAYWTGGRAVADGDAGSLYDPAAQSRLQREAVPGLDAGLSWFVAPPFVAVAYVPLGALPYGWACLVFAVLALGALVASGRLVAPALARVPGLPVGLVLLGLAASPAAFEALGSGQNSPFVLLFWVLAWRLHQAGREASAGALLALTVFKPHLVLLVPVWLVVRRRWRALGGFAVTGALLFAGPLALLPSGAVGSWRDALSSGTFGQEVQTGQTWKMSSLSALATDATGVARADVVVLVVGAAVLAWWLRRLGADPLRDAAIVALVTLCAAPHVMIYDTLLLVLPICWLAVVGGLAQVRWPLLALFVVQFTTAFRHVVADTVPLAGWVDWAWAAVPLTIVAVAAWRLSAAAERSSALEPEH